MYFRESLDTPMFNALTEWAEMIPAEFEVYPLIDPESAVAFLNQDASD